MGLYNLKRKFVCASQKVKFNAILIEYHKIQESTQNLQKCTDHKFEIDRVLTLCSGRNLKHDIIGQKNYICTVHRNCWASQKLKLNTVLIKYHQNS